MCYDVTPPKSRPSSLLSSSIQQGVKYHYTIQVEADGLLNSFSPPLAYTHGQPYCGDGVIQGSVTFLLLAAVIFIHPHYCDLDVGLFTLKFDGKHIVCQTFLGFTDHPSKRKADVSVGTTV